MRTSWGLCSPNRSQTERLAIAGHEVRGLMDNSVLNVRTDPRGCSYLLRRRIDANASKPKPINARLPGSGTRVQLAEVTGLP